MLLQMGHLLHLGPIITLVPWRGRVRTGQDKERVHIPFRGQTLESSLPQLLDDIFGTIFPFPSTLGPLKNYSKILSSVIIYNPKTK